MIIFGSDGVVCHGIASLLKLDRSSRQTRLPPDEEGRADDFQNCESNEW
jgi:hypothetical protein